MAILRLGGEGRVTGVVDFEGRSEMEIDLEADTSDPGAGHTQVRVDNAVMVVAAPGGYAVDVRQLGPSLLGLGPTISQGRVRNTTESFGHKQPVEHVVLDARVTGTGGTTPAGEQVVGQVGVRVDAATNWVAGIEERPQWVADNPPLLSLPSTSSGVRIGLMGPVDIVDAIVSDPPGYRVKRRLLLSGHILNPFLDTEALDLFADPAKSKPERWHVTVRDHGSGRVVLDRQLDPLDTSFPGFGTEKLWDGAAAQFHYTLPLPDATTFATVTLRLKRGSIDVTHEAEATLAPVDVLHVPIDLSAWAGQGGPLPPWVALNFGAGPGGDGSNGHKGDMTQRYALDMAVAVHGQTSRPPGSAVEDYWVWGQPVLAVADGEVIRVQDGAADMVNSSGEPNRVVVEHERDGRKTFSVYAHMRNGSMTVAVGDRVSAGDRLGEVGSNGESSGPHLHLAYYTFDPWGRLRMLPFAFTLADGTGGSVTGVPPPGTNMWLAPPAAPGHQSGDRPFGAGAAARAVVDAVVTFVREVRRLFGGGG